MNGFDKRKERIKEKIWRAALQLFMNQGISKVRIKEIANQANVSQVTIYNYFGSKEDLTKYVLDCYMNELYNEFALVLNGDQPFMKKLDWFFSAKENAFSTMHVNFLDSFISTEPEIAKVLQHFEERFLPLMIQFIKQGQNQGYFNQELSIETLLFYIQLFSSQALKQLEQMPEGEEKRRVYKEMLVLFFDGVKGKERS